MVSGPCGLEWCDEGFAEEHAGVQVLSGCRQNRPFANPLGWGSSSKGPLLSAVALSVGKRDVSAARSLMVFDNFIIAIAARRKTIRTTGYLLRSSFKTVWALSPTFAIASSISCCDVPKCLHQRRASSLLDRSTRFLGHFSGVCFSICTYPKLARSSSAPV